MHQVGDQRILETFQASYSTGKNFFFSGVLFLLDDFLASEF